MTATVEVVEAEALQLPAAPMNYWLHPAAREDLRDAALFYHASIAS